MRSHLLIRMVAVTAMLAGVTVGVFATAAPANAIRQCTGGNETLTYGVDPTGKVVTVDDALIFFNNLSCDENLPDSISKYIGNVGWQVVATGTGELSYNCTGGRALYTTSVTTKEGQPAFYCG